MSRFAVVKRNDSVYGMVIDIYGPSTFSHMTYDAFIDYVISIDAQSITWFNTRSEAIHMFKALGGKEYLIVNDDCIVHVLDYCPVRAVHYVVGEFGTIQDAQNELRNIYSVRD